MTSEKEKFPCETEAQRGTNGLPYIYKQFIIETMLIVLTLKKIIKKIIKIKVQ